MAERALEDWVLFAPLLKLASRGFEGSPTEVLNAINAQPGAKVRDPQWPKTAAQLTKHLNSRIDDLREKGVLAEYSKGTTRTWHLSTSPRPSQSTKLPKLNPLSPEVTVAMRSRHEGLIKIVSENAVIAFEHCDGSLTLWGRSATATAAKLNRSPAPGPCLRVTKAEWDASVELEDELTLLKA